jgi:hypothetical protein
MLVEREKDRGTYEMEVVIRKGGRQVIKKAMK